MKKCLPAVVLSGAALSLVVTGCSKDAPSAPATVTVTASESTSTVATTSASTVTSAASSASSAASSASSGTSSATTSASGVANSSIRQLEVTFDGYRKVGDKLFQMNHSSVIGSVKWRSKGEDGDLRSSECTVVVDITGPGGYDERRRSGACTGSTDTLPSMKVAGEYSAKVSVTPPGSTTATEETLIFTVLGAGE